MARRKADRSTETSERRAESNAVSAYLTALRQPKGPTRNRAKLEERRGDRNEITAAALREFGVPARALRRAGLM
jgi:hypothetical protein